MLGTQYTNHRATQLWEIGKLLQLDNGYWVHRNPDLGYLLEDYPPECAGRDQTLAYLAAHHFDELCSILPPLTDEDLEELKQSKMLTIQAIYDQLQSTLREYHQNGGTLEGVKEFLIMTTEEKRQMIHQQKDIDTQCILFAFFMLPPAVSIACIAKEFGAAFWEIWNEIGGQIPEAPCLYTPKPCPPVEPFSTQRLLDVNPDDMSYYWTPDSGLQFSDEFIKQMAEWRSELETITERIAPQDFLKTLADNISIGGSILFRDAFYEFISRQSDRWQCS